jgi:hypothetical protein
MKQTAVEWLAEKYNYVTWMRNRDEISPGLADMWREHYLDKAKEIERQQIINAFISGEHQQGYQAEAELYYNETFNTK